MKCWAASTHPTPRRDLIDGVPARSPHPAAADTAGISIIHPELACCPTDGAENIISASTGERFRRTGGMRRRPGRCCRGLCQASTRTGRPRPDHRRAADGGDRQALAIDARILVMDEPTAAPGRYVEAARLLDRARAERAGRGVVYIAQPDAECSPSPTVITVLEGWPGRGTGRGRRTASDDVVRMMSGPSAIISPPRPPRRRVNMVLRGEGGGNASVFRAADRSLWRDRRVARFEGSGKRAGPACVGVDPF